MRAALYLRVSTKRQAEQDLSIPDQRKQLEAYCEQRNWAVAVEFLEPGASATSDNRPAFQDMMTAAREKPRPFDVVIVHSFSRFARDSVDLGLYVRDLEKLGIRVVSITQETNADNTGDMMRGMIALFDEHQSRENAKHTLRAMKENARQGFWNGAPPPYGFKVVEAEKRGEKIKKKLAPDAKEAQIVRLMFRLYLNGDGTTGPLGVKAIAKHLNEKGYRQRQGRNFNNKFIQEALHESAYVGTYYFNRFDSKTRQRKPESERVASPCPSIVDQESFDAAQRLLHERNPRKTPGRRTNNPILLSGMVKCTHCGGTMSLRTGKGGKYRYYACLKQAKEGSASCKGTSIPMPFLDGAVTDALLDQVMKPERMAALLKEVHTDTVSEKKASAADQAQMIRKQRESQAKIDTLYEALENKVVDMDSDFTRRLNAAKAERDEAMRLKAQAERRSALPQSVITPKKLQAFSRGMADMLRNGDIQFRKAYLRLFVDRVDVLKDQVRVTGSTDTLMAAVAGGLPTKGGVPTLVHEWRPISDESVNRFNFMLLMAA